jgi:hypothetical protein
MLLVAGGTGVRFVLPVLWDMIAAPGTFYAVKKARIMWSAKGACKSPDLVDVQRTDQLDGDI